jgi:hypothetical protein
VAQLVPAVQPRSDESALAIRPSPPPKVRQAAAVSASPGSATAQWVVFADASRKEAPPASTPVPDVTREPDGAVKVQLMTTGIANAASTAATNLAERPPRVGSAPGGVQQNPSFVQFVN